MSARCSSGKGIGTRGARNLHGKRSIWTKMASSANGTSRSTSRRKGARIASLDVGSIDIARFTSGANRAVCLRLQGVGTTRTELLDVLSG